MSKSKKPAILNASDMVRELVVGVRFTPEEKAALSDLARQDNRTLSDWIRLQVLRSLTDGHR